MKQNATSAAPHEKSPRRAKLTIRIATVSILFSICFLFYTNLQANHNSGYTANSVADTVRVYICTGSGAYAYHSDRGCKFLNKCGSRIDTVSQGEALRLHRKPCRACVKPEEK